MERITYHIRYSRRKTISIAIKDGKVIVSAPHFTPKRYIASFVDSKESWIRKHLESQKSVIHLGSMPIHDGADILFLGNNYHLSVEKSDKNTMEICGDNINVSTKDCDNSYLTKLVERWYKEQATIFFSGKLKECIALHPEYDFRPSTLVVKKMKSRWGSCSKNGTITLNTSLMKIEPKFVEYVILHELSHLKEMNHSEKFYKILSDICPDYNALRKEMHQYSCS
ncbi:MAG: M48 family metallopeptidase [Bacteroidales bacterium]|nr:M48 family metallopeptidase [Bacteroidales bacterium]